MKTQERARGRKKVRIARASRGCAGADVAVSKDLQGTAGTFVPSEVVPTLGDQPLGKYWGTTKVARSRRGERLGIDDDVS
jgi:hypothetical protein